MRGGGVRDGGGQEGERGEPAAQTLSFRTLTSASSSMMRRFPVGASSEPQLPHFSGAVVASDIVVPLGRI